MFLAIAFVLGVLWALGLMKSYTFGGGIHLLLVAALVMAGFGLRQWWRRPMT